MIFRDLNAQYRQLKIEIDNAIQEVVEGGRFILGSQVAEIEKRLAEFVGRKHCVSCGSGTDALQLSLMTYGISSGDAVFTSDFTYFASAGTTSILGGTIIPVDIDVKTFNMNPDNLEKQIQKVLDEGKLRPKAVIPVDLFGQPADYDRIIPIAKKYGLKVIEDAAQGFGGNIRGKRACSFGDLSITSFFPAKPLGCYGDGGAVFTDDDEIKEKLCSLRCQGKSPLDKYDNREIGINSRLDTIQAAILIPKLKAFIEYELEAVNNVAGWYTERLKEIVLTPYVPEGYYSSWAQYTILLEERKQRDLLRAKLFEKNIPSMIYYPRGIHQQKAYDYMSFEDEMYPNTIEAINHCLSLPMHPYLSEEEVEEVFGVVKSAF